MTIASDVQKLSPGDRVVVYDIDMQEIDGGIFHFASGVIGGEKIRWQGKVYEPIPIQAGGFETNGRGILPTPRLTIANHRMIVAALISFDDLRLARLTRWETMRKYLDDQPTASPTEHYPPEIYQVDRKVRHNKTVIEWELKSAVDIQGTKIPGRVATKHYCPWIYRRYVQGVGFVNSMEANACPYAGGAMFEANGNPTGDPTRDKCGKRLDDCIKRFGDASLPYGGFPGISSVRA